MTATGGLVSSFFRALKPRFCIMENKRKPSTELGEIIRILVIVKVVITILHLLK